MGRETYDNLTDVGFEQITGLSSAKSLTVPNIGTIPNVRKPRGAYLQAEAQNVRYRADGTAPTAGIGMRLLPTMGPVLYTGDLTRLQFIEETASAKLNVSYVD